MFISAVITSDLIMVKTNLAFQLLKVLLYLPSCTRNGYEFLKARIFGAKAYIGLGFGWNRDTAPNEQVAQKPSCTGVFNPIRSQSSVHSFGRYKPLSIAAKPLGDEYVKNTPI